MDFADDQKTIKFHYPPQKNFILVFLDLNKMSGGKYKRKFLSISMWLEEGPFIFQKKTPYAKLHPKKKELSI